MLSLNRYKPAAIRPEVFRKMAVLKSGKIHNGVMTIPLEKLWAVALKSMIIYIIFP